MVKKLSLAQNALYNTIGSCVYLVCQWLITVLVIRLGSVESGGILTLAISVSGIFYNLSAIGRPYQVSDYSHKYSTGEYVGIRMMTCLAGFLLCIFYCLFTRDISGKEFACIIAYMAYRTTDALSDEYQAIQQIGERMDYIFRSFVMRGLLTLAAFCAVLATTKDVFLSLCAMTAMNLLVVIFYDIPRCRKLTTYHIRFSIKRCGQFLWNNLPLLLNSILLVSCVSIPRATLNDIWGNYILGIYGSISAPAAIVQNVAVWLIIPFVTRLTADYNEKRKPSYFSLHHRILLLIGGAIVIILIGAKLLGKWGLNLIFGAEIAAHDALLIPTLLTTAVIAIEYYISTLLTIARLFAPMIVGNAVAFVTMLVFQRPLISAYGMYGVNDIILISLGVNLLIQYVALLIFLKKWFSSPGTSEEEIKE